jgi:hypothetical protein
LRFCGALALWGDKGNAVAVKGEPLLNWEPLDVWRKWVGSLVHRLGCDDPQARTLDSETIQDLRRAHKGGKVPSQNDRPLPSISQPPNAWANLINAVAAVDLQCQTQLLAQPFLVERDRSKILWLDLDGAAFGALAKSAALAISDDLPSVQVAVWAKYVLLIDGSRLYGGAKQSACSELVRRQGRPKNWRPLSEQSAHQGPSMMCSHSHSWKAGSD